MTYAITKPRNITEEYEYKRKQFHYHRQALGFQDLNSKYLHTKELDNNYPSAYRQNVLVMLAKRLIQQEAVYA